MGVAFIFPGPLPGTFGVPGAAATSTPAGERLRKMDPLRRAAVRPTPERNENLPRRHRNAFHFPVHRARTQPGGPMRMEKVLALVSLMLVAATTPPASPRSWPMTT